MIYWRCNRKVYIVNFVLQKKPDEEEQDETVKYDKEFEKISKMEDTFIGRCYYVSLIIMITLFYSSI